MRRPLGPPRLLAVLLALLWGLLPVGLSACGSGDEPEAAPEPAPSSASSSSPVPVGSDATLLSETSAGGATSKVAVRLDGPDGDAGVATLTADLHDRLSEKIAGVVETTEVPTGHELYGAVVAVGCDVPPGIAVERRGSAVRLVPEKASTTLKECYAPITTVAVVPVPAA